MLWCKVKSHLDCIKLLTAIGWVGGAPQLGTRHIVKAHAVEPRNPGLCSARSVCFGIFWLPNLRQSYGVNKGGELTEGDVAHEKDTTFVLQGTRKPVVNLNQENPKEPKEKFT